MRALRFEFHPEQVRISSEEILADLRCNEDGEAGGSLEHRSES